MLEQSMYMHCLPILPPEKKLSLGNAKCLKHAVQDCNSDLLFYARCGGWAAVAVSCQYEDVHDAVVFVPSRD